MGSMLARMNQPEMRWPPNDTEESVVGTDWHQTTIMNALVEDRRYRLSMESVAPHNATLQPLRPPA